MLLVGYFEGIGSQRGIAWRCADSLSLRTFLGVPLTEDTPDHSSLTRVRDRFSLEVHVKVFRFVLQIAFGVSGGFKQDHLCFRHIDLTQNEECAFLYLIAVIAGHNFLHDWQGPFGRSRH